MPHEQVVMAAGEVPGYLGLVSSTKAVDAAAEAGVILLMFTCGIEFALEPLARVWRCSRLPGLHARRAGVGASACLPQLRQRRLLRLLTRPARPRPSQGHRPPRSSPPCFFDNTTRVGGGDYRVPGNV